jgi:hypothetical protein
MKKSKIFALIVILPVAVMQLFGGQAWAQDPSSYDRYTTELRKTETPTNGQNIARHLLVYPLELFKWPMDKGSQMIEQYRLDKKFFWILQKLDENGIAPYSQVMSFTQGGVGASVDFVKLARLRSRYPDLVAKSWISYIDQVNFETGAKIGLDRIADTGFRTYGTFQYNQRPQEHFFGIGPHTSRGDGYVYKMENTQLGYSFGYSPKPSLGADVNLLYQHVNIYGGRDGSMGQLQTGIFTQDKVPGLRGDELLSIGPEIKYDTRNAQDNSNQGGLHRAAMNYNKGFDNSNGAMYFKYEAEISRYLRLWSDRRTLVLHAAAETNSEVSGYYVPFHQMPRLGGMGEYPRLNRTMRGYEFNRFTDKSLFVYNMEYRYNIWKYREIKVDTTLFWDVGNVFDRVSTFQFNTLRSSFGPGFRLHMANVSLLTLQLGLSEEGTEFYVHTQTPF